MLGPLQESEPDREYAEPIIAEVSHGAALPAQRIDERSRWQSAASTLLARSCRKHSDLADQLGVATRHVPTLLRASAGCAMKNEENLLEKVFGYCDMMLCSGQAVAGRLIHKVKYDETRMRLRCAFDDGPLHDAFAKTFCILESWTILLTTSRKGHDHIVFQGSLATEGASDTDHRCRNHSSVAG